MSKTVLFIEDDNTLRDYFSKSLRRHGYEVLEAGTLASACELLSTHWVDMIILDRMLPDGEGLFFLKELRLSDPYMPVTVLSAHHEVERVVEAMHLNAVDYLPKPAEFDALLARVRRMDEMDDMRRELEHLHQRTRIGSHDWIVGSSPSMRRVAADVEQVAKTRTTVLVTGESGTGKEVVAQLIHAKSPRGLKLFCPVNCAAVPDDLLENELFGHEPGAYTDAGKQKKGLLEVADGGTVFLDEVGNMRGEMQAKLLRVLEERSLRRIGGTRDIPVDIRLVAATNRNLEEEVKEGRFRLDLYYRLSVVCIQLPPLRERAADVPLLVASFLERYNREMGKNIGSVNPAALAALQAYSWPGNIRDLRNAIECACVFCDGDQIELSHLPSRVLG